MSSRTLRSDQVVSDNTVVDYWQVFRDLPEAYLLCEASDPYIVLEVNKMREKLSGVDRKDCVGRSLLEIYPYTDVHFRATVLTDLRQKLKQIVRSGRSQQFRSFRQIHIGSDGVKRGIYLQPTYYPLRDSSGHVRYILVETREVTEELEAMDRVATAESRLGAALKIGKVGSWMYDVSTNKITGDDNFNKLFHLKRGRATQLTIEGFLEAINPDDRSRVSKAVAKSLKHNTPFEEEYRVMLEDGTRMWLLARGKAEVYETRTVFAGVVVDITEQRDLQAQVALARQQDRLNRRVARILQHRNEELEAISRSKDEFVALASHQLRTPATAVKQYIGMMLQGYVGDVSDMQADVLEKAFESNERQLLIINQILNAARVDTGRLVMTPVPLDLRSLVQAMANDMESSIRQHRQSFSTIVPDRPVLVAADLGYLRMAIENVLHNANVYTPEGGRIAIKLSKTRNRCTLLISDTGVGIRKADLGKLFVKFSRINNPLSVEAGGTGIGLYLTAEIIRLHGGEVDVESHVGKGTTFAISLPLVHNNKSRAASGSR